MIKNSFIVAFTLLLFACDKGNEFQKNELSGRVLINDTINKPGFLIPAADASVFYSTDGTTRNFLFKTKTDNSGNFSFSHIRNTTEDMVVASDTVNGVLFEGALAKSNFISGNNNELVLFPVVGNGLKITVFDSLNTQVNNCQVCIYSSRLTYLKDSCALGFRSLSANENGIAFFNNMVPRDSPYLITATLAIDTMIYKGRTEAVVNGSQKVTSRRITLFRVK